MTDPKSRPQIPSERVSKLADELRPKLKGTALETSEVELRFTCLLAYLDERETQLHPIARAHPTGLLRPAVSVSAPTAPPELVAYVRHPDGAKTPITPRQWAQAVLAHPAPTSSPGEGIPMQYPMMHAAIEKLEGELTEARANLTHDGATAAEWASRYADLANAAAQAVGVLAVNDPVQRMVKERLEGVLAGQAYEPEAARHYAETTEANCTVRLPYSDPLCAFREVTRWRDMQARTYEDGCKLLERFQALEQQHAKAQAELTRLKEENAVLDARRKHVEAEWLSKFTDEKAAHEVTRRDKSDLVDASRDVVAAFLDGRVNSSGATLSRLRAALFALDQPTQAEPATPPESPVPAEAQREIRVGSKWRRRKTPGSGHRTGIHHAVTGFNASGWVTTEAVELYEPSAWNPEYWHEQLEWVSDPEPPAEQESGAKP